MRIFKVVIAALAILGLGAALSSCVPPPPPVVGPALVQCQSTNFNQNRPFFATRCGIGNARAAALAKCYSRFPRCYIVNCVVQRPVC